jgi:hypothetical protein
MDSEHNAQKDCGLGLLPFTKTNFMCRLPGLTIAIVVRHNLMIWNGAIYCTRVVRDSLVVSLR